MAKRRITVLKDLSSRRQNFIVLLQGLQSLGCGHPDRAGRGNNNDRDDDLGVALVIRIEPDQRQT